MEPANRSVAGPHLHGLYALRVRVQHRDHDNLDVDEDWSIALVSIPTTPASIAIHCGSDLIGDFACSIGAWLFDDSWQGRVGDSHLTHEYPDNQTNEVLPHVRLWDTGC